MLRSEFLLKGLLTLLVLLTCRTVIATDCEPHDIAIKSQTELDLFQETFGTCSRIKGNLTIIGSDFTHLTPLSELVEIAGDLSIIGSQNLFNLRGLSKLQTVSSLIVLFNARLQSLAGLDSLQVIGAGIEVSANPEFVSLQGMPKLESIGTSIEVRGAVLTDLHPLSKVKISGPGKIDIRFNPNLISLEGIPEVSVLNNLYIVRNDKLVSLSGLRVNNGKVLGDVWIRDNGSLADVSGMEWLQSVNDLMIFNNDLLLNLNGLPNLRAVGTLSIRDNEKLSDCSSLSPLFDVIDHDEPGPSRGIYNRYPDIGSGFNIDRNDVGCDIPADFAYVPDVIRIVTGSWYDPRSAGEGFMIHAVQEPSPFIYGYSPGRSGLAVGYFFGFDAHGERFWVIGIHQSEEEMEWESPIEFVATAVSGGSFEGFRSSDTESSEWGKFSFIPGSCAGGEIEIEGSVFNGGDTYRKVLYVSKLANVSGDYCSEQVSNGDTDSLTGSWYDPATSGQGFAIHKINETSGIVYFYGFDNNQSPLWLVGTWSQPLLPGEPIELKMEQVSGGTFFRVNPEEVVREFWGTLLLELQSCGKAYAELNGLDGKQVFFMDQLAGSLSLDCIE